MNMRLLVYFCLITLLGGCASQTYPAFLTPRDQLLFVQGMDEIAAGEDYTATFTTLQETWPESPWTQKAQNISALLDKIRKQQQTIDRLTREQTVCRRQNKALRLKAEALQSDREKLRRLMIDLEKRGR